MPSVIRPATDELLNGLFGRTDVFTHYSYVGGFCTFHVRDYASKRQPNFWTGVCLSELHNILQQDAWTCCMHTRDSRSSPKSLWGCTTLGMALDRAHLDRGHAKLSGDRPTGWDLPVAIGAWWPPPRLELHQPLSNGSLVVHVPVHAPDEEMTRLPLDSLNWSMVKIHKPSYDRYNTLARQWDHLNGETAPLVLCQTRNGHELEDFLRRGHGGDPVSCGRVEHRTTCEAVGWARTGSGKWQCPDCRFNGDLRLSTCFGVI